MFAFRPVYLIILPFLALVSCSSDQVEIAPLTASWLFKHPDSTSWLPARVPGSVHINLMDHHFIEDPYFGNNEKELQWVGESDWEFKTSFSGKALSTQKKTELVFEGLDTYADVYLNDSCILHADNMFRRWEVDVKDHLLEGTNNLYIRFFAPERMEADKAKNQLFALPEQRGFSRKAPYQYGWDWGPKFITAGIWQPVFLRGWNEVRIVDVQTRLESLATEEARYRAVLEINATSHYTAVVTARFPGENIPTKNNVFQLKKGTNNIEIEFSIPEPALWWPNGSGEQNLYDLEFLVETRNAVDSKKLRLGVRQVELVREADSIGESFYFLVNGKKTFMKGANYIPQDNFLSRVPDEKYRQTLQAAADANMNMIRIWGGGIYEKDIFYDLCDELGLLVWQDFMFACNLYPGDSAFLDNVQQEAVYQVKRLRNHPSLALWCGNNEVNEGWFNWGWQKSLGYSIKDSTEAWNNYLSLFEQLLPEVIHAHDSSRSYWPSSPSTGWGHESALYSGDMHYWGVWWGEEPFGIYKNKVGRFMSEYGFQGFPAINTLDSCLDPTDLRLGSPNLLNHQKHPRGMELINAYMEREYPVPPGFDEYAYVSQLVQAYGIRTALEAHRRAKPTCMGTLYWQLNDCWPVISWSSLDYYNQWKALHYFTRDIYKNLAVSVDEAGEKLNVYVISDLMEQKKVRLEMTLLNMEGFAYWWETRTITLEENSSLVCFSTDTDSLLSGNDRAETFLSLKLKGEDDTMLAKQIVYFAPPRELNLAIPHIQTSCSHDANDYIISISDTSLLKNVYLTIDIPGHFSDNFFDLIPGDTLQVKFSPAETMTSKLPGPEAFADRLKILTLNTL